MQALPADLDVHDEDQRALGALLNLLRQADYHFVTPSPFTHRRVLQRQAQPVAQNLRDVFGWSLPFRPDLLSNGLMDALWAAELIDQDEGLLRSRVRISSLGAHLFLHSAFPTTAEDAVFFGPDTYRFANFLTAELAGASPIDLLVDIGAGSGAGAVVAAALAQPKRTVLTDLNLQALRLARANAAHAGMAPETILGDGLESVGEPIDLAIANPPFIAGDNGHTYRDGGDLHGAQLSLDWTLAAAQRLAPRGRLLLYTGSAIVEGQDLFHQAITANLSDSDFEIAYRELDPDIFGDQLSDPAYADVERIAAVGLSVRRRGLSAV
ncbi:methyltransferase [Phenylobacterium sp.]|uniref:methyltransferase n=1 Tax=Phenylobacterium sp. TaxID=1871053 RepID=UPI00272FBA4D|nr:methyltransferase [Phenylobacterium sp.]MDP1617285.1 methyltransferase [Phenylobacterium sp.]MDP1987232.1 methyltransferase [Phenylobacterium sp.]